MDIRTKLVFALVAVALASMAVLGVFLSLGAMEALKEGRLQHLDGLAEAKREGLEQVVAGWEDRVRLVAGSTQLRESLAEHIRTQRAGARSRLEQILGDALDASAGVESLVIHDEEGRRVGAGFRGDEPRPESGGELPGVEARGEALGAESPHPVLYEGTTYSDGQAQVGFRAPLLLDGDTLGLLRVRLRPRELFELASIGTGLGETGETVIVLPGGAGTVRTIRRTRGGGAVLSAPVDSAAAADPVRWGLHGPEGRFPAGLVDAGGDVVWGTVRRLGGTGWGLVVKIDADEGREPVVALRSDLMRVALSLGAFAILAGVVLGFRFTRPILDLSGVADRIRAGELDARAEVATQDEVGLLARTFNGMAEELEQRMGELREFHTFFEVSPDLLCIAGTDGYFKRVNPSFERLLGWSPEELLSRPITTFVHPDDVGQTRKELESLSAGVPTIAFENRYEHADGGYRRLRWTCHPEPRTGALYAAARIVEDESPGDDRDPGDPGDPERAP